MPQPNQSRGGFNMDDYVPVAERVAAFYERFPEGSLQAEIVELTEARVLIRGYAYRTADDARPGIAHSSLNIPGSTPYTRGSEVENAETSAIGRAIAMLGFEVKRGIATAEEVRNKQEERPAPTPLRGRLSVSEELTMPTDEELAELHGEPEDAPWDYAAFRAACKAMAGPKPDLKAVVTSAAKLFPTKGLELHEPKMWQLSDQEWRQLAAVLGAIPA